LASKEGEDLVIDQDFVYTRASWNADNVKVWTLLKRDCGKQRESCIASDRRKGFRDKMSPDSGDAGEGLIWSRQIKLGQVRIEQKPDMYRRSIQTVCSRILVVWHRWGPLF